MATIDLVKIALKSTTKMSLNERFQLLRQNQMRRQSNALNTNKMVANNTRLELRQGSQKNRRLALQMANRPSVLAALRSNNSPTNRSVKQRLGNKRFNNQNNAFNANQNTNRMNGSNLATNGMNRNRKMSQNRRNNTQNIGVIVGVRRKGLQRNRLRRTQRTQTFKATPNVNAFKAKRRVGPFIRNQNQPKMGNNKKLRINRNFNSRNNTAKQQKRPNVKPNREQLDNDLDAYMAATKTHLDAELDAYMSETH